MVPILNMYYERMLKSWLYHQWKSNEHIIYSLKNGWTIHLNTIKWFAYENRIAIIYIWFLLVQYVCDENDTISTLYVSLSTHKYQNKRAINCFTCLKTAVEFINTAVQEGCEGVIIICKSKKYSQHTG